MADRTDAPIDGETTDLLVVGSGIAGCAAALAGARAGANVTLATEASRPADATSYWAQGGIAVTRDDPEALKRDVIDASDGTADPAAVDVLVSGADAAVQDVLIDTLGVAFDEGYGREAAHDEARIRHVDAATGRHVLVPFLEHLRGLSAVEILEDTAALELCTHEGRVHGALLERDGEVTPWFAGATVLATGGIGACYPRSTNPRTATGDGIAMAALAGADVADMEYVQFHPTAFAGEGTDERATGNEPDGSGSTPDRGTFLLSEAIRGEGAVLRDATGERFMPEYHPDAELAPRDVVARAVAAERERTGEVVLDVTPIDFAGEFPALASECADRGVSLEDGIPVAPAEHFLCGGIDVDLEGRTSLDRLYAVGECARTGVHGANRLASTSLLEGLVWGLRAGETAADAGVEAGPEPIEPPELLDRDPALPDRFAAEKFHRLRRVMDEELGIVRDPAGIERAQATIRRLKGEVDAYTRTRTSRALYELRGACVSALLIARAAAANEESRGCHQLTEGAPVDAD
ncbi:FAD-dependent oxidoreductase [Halopenitus sp. POP-27]|uniref:L-aspartate oxidase n=1 Tax=Halopenitus sp. POP-27 TaxID=2994425 RepID=UPI002469B7C4|nr:FAD-dependent oxidoreductase [Halopenitus sp. POP-27]